MKTISVEVSEQIAKELEQRASRLGMSVEDLIREGLVEILSRDDDEFLEAAEYVMKKNDELYRRLS